MKDSFNEGEWWIPGKQNAMPGRLSVDSSSKKFILQIFGNTYLDGSSIDTKKNQRIPNHSLIIGKAPGNITLFQCSWNGTTLIGTGLYQINYEIGYIFHDIHVNAEQDLLVAAGEFLLPQLSSFLNEGFPDSLIIGEPSLMNSKKDIYKITQKLSLEFITVTDHHCSNIFDGKYYKKLRLIYTEPIAFKELLEDAIYFKKLLEFSYGKPQRCNILNIFLSNGKQTHVGNLSLSGNEKIAKHPRASYHMLLSSEQFKEQEFIQSIKLWYAYRPYSTIFDYYLDSNYWLEKSEEKLSHVMFNNRFLNIIQGLENYHRKFLGTVSKNTETFERKKKEALSYFTQRDKNLKQWLEKALISPKGITLAQRLDAILHDFEPEINQWFQNKSVINHFSWYASNMRNSLSHGYQKQTQQGKEFRLFLITGQLLLAACILKALKVPEVGATIQHYQQFQDYLYEINLSKIKII